MHLLRSIGQLPDPRPGIMKALYPQVKD